MYKYIIATLILLYSLNNILCFESGTKINSNIQDLSFITNNQEILTQIVLNIVETSSQNYLINALNKKGEMKFLDNSTRNINEESKNLNISDFSINAILFMGQRLINTDYKVNNSTEGLPLALDTNTLVVAIQELSVYKINTNMTVRIFYNNQKYPVPQIATAIDGITIYLTIGLEFSTDPVDERGILLNIDLPIYIKLQMRVINEKLTLNIYSIGVSEITINQNNLGVDKDKLRMNFVNLLQAVAGSLASQLSNIDVLASLNKFTKMNFTHFKIVLEYGSMLLQLS